MTALFSDTNGKIRVNEFPEKTRSHCPGRGFCSCDDPPARRCDVLVYDEAIQAALDNGVECESQEKAADIIIRSIPSPSKEWDSFIANGFEPMKPYPIPDYKMEVKEVCKPITECGYPCRDTSRCSCMCKLAMLIEK